MPGGAYEMLSMYSEGIQLAQRMERDGGYKAFLLNYRMALMLSQSQMDEALAAAGVPHLCELYPTGDHGVGLAYGCSSRRWSEERLVNFFETVWKDHARLS
ncbi:MAG: hypothetical protein V8S31_11660 [Lachnospiraceae bacterium]